MVLCNVDRYKNYLRLQPGDLVCAFCSDPHGNMQDRGRARPPQPSRANAQRTPDWTPVTTAAETHVPASPSCGVATWARWYQAPKTAKLPRWGGPRLHDGGAGAKNASCFFGRTLRNIHFRNARLTPSDTHFPTPRCPSPFQPSAPHQPPSGSGPVGDAHMLTHATHSTRLQPEAESTGRQPWHDLT